jgi:hypothetical protein
MTVVEEKEVAVVEELQHHRSVQRTRRHSMFVSARACTLSL